MEKYIYGTDENRTFMKGLGADLLAFGHRFPSPDRMHWTLAEAINTSAFLFRATGKSRYADDYAMYTEYLDDCVVDHEKGSWFHQLDDHNEVIGTVWPGKSDIYHALQATIIPYGRTDRSVICLV